MQKLVRIEPKHFFYHNDGSGRDFYISKLNGGLLDSNIIKKLSIMYHKQAKSLYFKKQYEKRLPIIRPSVVHYKSNGTGRDVYIKYNDGGLSHPQNKNVSFFKSLRSYTPEKNNLKLSTSSMDIHSSKQLFKSSILSESQGYLRSLKIKKKGKIRKLK